MSQIEINQPAGAGEVFAPTAFDSQIGKVIPVKVEGRSGHVSGRVIDAQVSEDGGSVHLTLDVPDGLLPRPTFRPGDIGFR